MRCLLIEFAEFLSNIAYKKVYLPAPKKNLNSINILYECF